MTKNECFNLGYISRKVGNHGELAFTLDVDDPGRYYKLASVFIELNHSLVPFFIKKIQGRGHILTVKIEGIDTIERAEELVKSGLYLPLTLLPPLSGKKFYFHEMPGYTVTDKVHGDIGVVEEVLDFPQQAIFKIRKGTHEILIPAKDEFIVELNREKRHLSVNAPEGLIDLYTGSQQHDPSEKETDQE